MCILIINRFRGCAHHGSNTPSLRYIDQSSCQVGGNCNEPLRTEVKLFAGPCFGCLQLRAPEGDKIVGWFKHCMFSTRCNHEHSHCEVVGLERYESEEDFILETPSNEFCPGCADSGVVIDQPSVVPMGYHGRSHVSMDDFASSRATGLSMASMRPRAPRPTQVGHSRMPDSLDSGPRAQSNTRPAFGARESSGGGLSAGMNSESARGRGGRSSARAEHERRNERRRAPSHDDVQWDYVEDFDDI